MTESDVYEITEHRRVREVRRALRTWLKKRKLTAMQDEALLVTSELATNALLYGGGWARIAFLETETGVRIEVTDHNRIIPVVGVASDRSMTGRGLALVHNLAVDWGVESAREGKVVWADLAEGGSTHLTTPWSVHDMAIGTTHIDDGRTCHLVALGNVPTDLLIGGQVARRQPRARVHARRRGSPDGADRARCPSTWRRSSIPSSIASPRPACRSSSRRWPPPTLARRTLASNSSCRPRPPTLVRSTSRPSTRPTRTAGLCGS